LKFVSAKKSALDWAKTRVESEAKRVTSFGRVSKGTVLKTAQKAKTIWKSPAHGELKI
jgi:hypothetical protein